MRRQCEGGAEKGLKILALKIEVIRLQKGVAAATSILVFLSIKLSGCH